MTSVVDLILTSSKTLSGMLLRQEDAELHGRITTKEKCKPNHVLFWDVGGKLLSKCLRGIQNDQDT